MILEKPKFSFWKGVASFLVLWVLMAMSWNAGRLDAQIHCSLDSIEASVSAIGESLARTENNLTR